MKERWKAAIKDKKFRIHAIASITLAIILFNTFPRFFEWVEARHGYVLNDIVLNAFTPMDVSTATFAFLYSGIIFALVFLIPHPKHFLLAFEIYLLMLTMRIVTIYIVPLNPPSTMLPLEDPIGTAIAYGGKFVTKDLFFSGHTGTLCALFFGMKNNWGKVVVLICVTIVGSCVLLQHVHYTIDVLAAPLICFILYRIVMIRWKKDIL